MKYEICQCILIIIKNKLEIRNNKDNIKTSKKYFNNSIIIPIIYFKYNINFIELFTNLI